MFSNRGLLLLALTAFACQVSEAFTTSSTASHSFLALSMGTREVIDVSIEYDAAARLAYDEWRQTYNKGAFDSDRYAVFKANYDQMTVANVQAKKGARESGGDAPRLLSLNEYGDFTAEEYAALQSGAAVAPAPAPEPAASSSGDVLGKAVEAVEAQAAASSALSDAADAIAEEEEVSEYGVDSDTLSTLLTLFAMAVPRNL